MLLRVSMLPARGCYSVPGAHLFIGLPMLANLPEQRKSAWFVVNWQAKVSSGVSSRTPYSQWSWADSVAPNGPILASRGNLHRLRWRSRKICTRSRNFSVENFACGDEPFCGGLACRLSVSCRFQPKMADQSRIYPSAARVGGDRCLWKNPAKTGCAGPRGTCASCFGDAPAGRRGDHVSKVTAFSLSMPSACSASFS